MKILVDLLGPKFVERLHLGLLQGDVVDYMSSVADAGATLELDRH
jgi:hypothetical protein